MLTLRDKYKMKGGRRSSVFQQMEVTKTNSSEFFPPFEAFFSRSVTPMMISMSSNMSDAESRVPWTIELLVMVLRE